MDPFEQQIHSLPWAKPSPGLKERIFCEPGRSQDRWLLASRRIALGWAAALVVLAGLAGYFWGQQQSLYSLSLSEQPTIDVQVVETGSGPNLFDMTPRASEILPGDLVVSFYVAEDY